MILLIDLYSFVLCYAHEFYITTENHPAFLLMKKLFTLDTDWGSLFLKFVEMWAFVWFNDKAPVVATLKPICVFV